MNGLPTFQGGQLPMKTSTQIRNTGPMIEARRRIGREIQANKAIAVLVAQGWVRTVTEHGLTLTEPRPAESVKTDTNG